MMAHKLQFTEKRILPFLSLFPDGPSTTLAPVTFLLAP